MNIPSTELLTKVSRSPGLCTAEEIHLAVVFLNEFKVARDAYRAAYGFDPIGQTLETQLRDLEYYEAR